MTASEKIAYLQAKVDRHRDKPRSDAYKAAVLRLQIEKHEVLRNG